MTVVVANLFSQSFLVLNMALHLVTIPCGFDNLCYLVICDESGLAAVVDPTEAWPVWQAVEADGARLVAVLCTHHHRDHLDGLDDLLAEQPELMVYGFTGDRDRIGGLNRPLTDGAIIEIGALQATVLHSPGHTSGSLCYHIEDVVFTGDTLFGAGCGRLFEGSPDQLHNSLRRLGSLDRGTRLCFGHEYTARNLAFGQRLEPDIVDIARRLADIAALGGGSQEQATLALEQLTNPFLRCHTRAIRENFPELAPGCPDLEIFGRLRQLRDSF